MKFNRKDFFKLSLVSLISFKVHAQNNDTENIPHNIKNFGAKGDGKSDDSIALKRCLKKFASCYIPRGHFLLNEVQIKDAKIYGNGEIKTATGAQYAIGLGSNTHLDGITFSAITPYKNSISDIKLLESASNIKITNCNFNSSTYSAINADANGIDDSSLSYKKNAANILISQNIFNGKYSRHIYLHSVQEIQILSNQFLNSLFDSIRLRQNTSDIIISSNLFKNIGTQKSTDSQDAIDTYWSGNKLIISDNIIDKCSKHGLDIKGRQPSNKYGSDKIQISNNQIRNTQHCGISLSAGATLKDKKISPIENIIIHSNIIEKNNTSRTKGNAAIQLRQSIKSCQIYNNQVQNNYGRGIFVFNPIKGAPQSENIIISKNICLDNGYQNDAHGIIITDVKDLICTDNICKNTKSGNTQIVGIAITHNKALGFNKTTGVIENNIVSGHKHNMIN